MCCVVCWAEAEWCDVMVWHALSWHGVETRIVTIIEIPGTPPSPNELRRKYRSPFAYKQLRQQFEHDLAYGISGGAQQKNLLIKESANRRMTVEVTLYHARFYDTDNAVGALKPVLDALVRVHYLKDDSPQWLNLLPVSQIKCAGKHARTVIKITPSEPNPAE